MKHRDEVYTVYPGGRGFKVKEQSDDYGSYRSVNGQVHTPYGIINAWSHWSSRGRRSQSSGLEIIADGFLYVRWFEKAYSARYLVTLAKRFAKELFE